MHFGFQPDRQGWNGDPYYAVLNNKPDAIKAWVKFKAGDDNNNPTASISALLSNGKKYKTQKTANWKITS